MYFHFMQRELLFNEEDKELTAHRFERKGDREMANCLYSEMLDEYPETARLYHRRGKNNFHLNDFEKALNDFNRAIKYCKTKHEYYASRAILHLKLKNYKEAEQDLRYASHLSKRKIPYSWSLGNLYYEIGDYKNAIKRLKIAIYGKDKFNAYKITALCHFKLNNYPSALSALINAGEIDPTDHWVQFSIGRCYYTFASKESSHLKIHYAGVEEWLAAALKHLTESIKLDPTYAYAYWMRGECYYMLEMYEESAADFSSAIKYNPNEIGFYEGWERSHKELLD